MIFCRPGYPPCGPERAQGFSTKFMRFPSMVERSASASFYTEDSCMCFRGSPGGLSAFGWSR
jgi:hypothetical protein